MPRGHHFESSSQQKDFKVVEMCADAKQTASAGLLAIEWFGPVQISWLQ